MAIDHSMVFSLDNTHMFIATEVQLPLGRSVIISNGKNASIALPEYVRIQ